MKSILHLKILTGLAFIISLSSCGDNTQIESDSDTYIPAIQEQTEEVIDNTFEDSFSSPNSSWIKGADYNSEDGEYGMMNIYTDAQKYTFIDVPVSVWNDFKNAPSKGSYYHANIKGRYQL